MTELLREKIEAEAETWIAPYRQAVTGAVLHATHEGEVHVSASPDLGPRIKAAEAAFDRAYGKPRQTTDVAIADHPENFGTELMQNPEVSEAAHELLRRAGAARARRLEEESKRPDGAG